MKKHYELLKELGMPFKNVKKDNSKFNNSKLNK